MNLSNYFNKAITYEEYVELLNESKQLHLLHYKNFNLSKDKINQIRNLPAMHILAITEPWCGDSLALLPIVKKISLANSSWKLKVILRDQNTELIDQFLTNGKRAIPIFLFLNKDFELQFSWGPRPQKTQEIFDKYKQQIQTGEIEKSKVILKIRQFYAKDKGKESASELLDKIFSSIN